MYVSAGAKKLKETLGSQSWLAGIVDDSMGRVIVYANDLSSSVISKIPDTVAGQHVLVHFASSKDIDKSKYRTMIIPSFVSAFSELKTDDESDPDMDHLIERLAFLRKEYAEDILHDIYYEVFDGKNAVTQRSIRYPEVRKLMDDLYDMYGFDVLYGELG